MLLVPHLLVLAVLWPAFVVATVIAGIMILFTGRYPHSLFHFNVGVLRWSWRVGFYGYSTLGTDRYPPFTLAKTDYPADFDVAYPQRLNRPLVLVKSWLLALPHLVLIGLVTTGATSRPSEVDLTDSSSTLGLSVVGALILITGITLLVTQRYPRGLFNLLVGLNRWLYRVIAYVALMTDVYPPFRLDQGPTEPQSELPAAISKA